MRARTRMDEAVVDWWCAAGTEVGVPLGAGEPVIECDLTPFEHPPLFARESESGSRSTLERLHDRVPHASSAFKREATAMKVLHRRCAGLDVHKDEVVACVRVVKRSKASREVRRVATTTRGLLECWGLRTGWGRASARTLRWRRPVSTGSPCGTC